MVTKKRDSSYTYKDKIDFKSKTVTRWDFPGGPVVKTLPSSAGGEGSITGQGAKIPHALGPINQKHKTEEIL